MDEPVYSARTAVSSAVRPNEPLRDPASRFRTLVQSPLRAAILRHLHANPAIPYDVASLMQVFGRMPLDIENCLTELVHAGLARRDPADGERFVASRPASGDLSAMLDAFLEKRARITAEDESPSVQRFREMIGRDEKMLVVFEWIRTAAKSDISVLILGATGCGKEVVARMIHELSRRRAGRFQAVNCAALPDSLFESEIFGYEKGAFTGAHDRKPGRVELADQGTLFLDEIGDLSVMAQAKLLRVLEDRRFERLGGNKPVQVDFRLISATNRPLDLLVRDGRFREDLYYRINAFAIRLPSLKERRVDIQPLAQRFLARYCAWNNLPPDGKVFSREALDAMTAHSWAGNIRELESTVARAALSAPGRVIRASDVEFLSPVSSTEDIDSRLPSLRDAERLHVLRVLESVGWNKKQAAEVLEISRGTLYRKISEYGLEAPSKSAEPASGVLVPGS
jgi:DNA-binding NtrC family response regulator